MSLAGAIAGQVTASESGAGIAGATVTAVGSDGTPYQATTGPGGVYELGGLPADTYTILAEADGRAQEEVTGVTVNGAERGPELQSRGPVGHLGNGDARGGWSHRQRASWSWRSRRATPIPTWSSAATVSGSGFTIANLPAGTYDLSISEDGYVPQTLSNVVVAAGGHGQHRHGPAQRRGQRQRHGDVDRSRHPGGERPGRRLHGHDPGRGGRHR